MIVIALALLSPLHHFELYLGKLRYALARMFPSLLSGSQKEHSRAAIGLEPTVAEVGFGSQMAAGADEFKKIGQIILFVCSGNTCRSPMAAAIGNAEIARRLRIPSAGEACVQALSAGVSARDGAPMTTEAKQALQSIGISANGHRASNLTAELAHQVEKIFCMTQAHRDAVIEIAPAAAGKTLCLDPDGDVEDPMGSELANYVNCARRIHSLVRLRFDEIGLQGHLQS